MEKFNYLLLIINKKVEFQLLAKYIMTLQILKQNLINMKSLEILIKTLQKKILQIFNYFK